MKTLGRRLFGVLLLIGFPIHWGIEWMFKDMNVGEAGKATWDSWKMVFWYPPRPRA